MGELLAASGVGAHALAEVLLLFGAALVSAWLMCVFRAPTILGFLLAGAVIGPGAFNLVPRDEIEFFAELGLAFLLFVVGLELEPRTLLRLGPRLAIAAAVQIGVTGLLVALAAGWLLPLGWTGAILVGAGGALSSTAIVLKHLSDRGQTDSPTGSLITGILIIQDVAVILLLIALPLMGGDADAGSPLVSGALAIAGLLVVSVVAWFALPVAINWVFRFGGPELLTLFAIVTACLGAWLAAQADWSWALGAFVAGLLLARSDLHHQLRAEIAPFRDAMNALFFISIGMLVDLELMAGTWPLLLVVVVASLVIKAMAAGAAAWLGGWPIRIAVAAGVGLATMSEFGYVLAYEAVPLGLLPEDVMPALINVIVGTMVLGALLIPLGGPLADRVMSRLAERPDSTARPPADAHGAEHAPAAHLAEHVMIVGYGINGQNLATVLKATRIPYAVIEMNRGTARRLRNEGVTVIVGDAARRSILEEAGLATARALVIAIADAPASQKIVAQARAARPELYILARTRFISELDTLYALGATRVIPEEFETSVEIFAHVLKEFAVPDNIIEQQVTLIRAGRYGMLRGRPTDQRIRAEWMGILEAAATQTVLVAEESEASGKTIRELDLRARTGATVVAVTRSGQATAAPGPDVRLQAGDVLVVVGTHRALAEVRRMLTPAQSEN